MVAIPMRLRSSDGELAFITMIATFGTALDITLTELAIETFLPADVDIAGPGVSIYSTYKDGGYATLSGTSMATPHVTGAVALYVAQHGAATDAAGVAAIRQAITTPGGGFCVAQSDPRGFAGDLDSFPEPLVYVGPAAAEQIPRQVRRPVVGGDRHAIQPRRDVGRRNQIAVVAERCRGLVDLVRGRRRGFLLGARRAGETVGEPALERGPVAARHGREGDVNPEELDAADRERVPIPERMRHPWRL